MAYRNKYELIGAIVNTKQGASYSSLQNTSHHTTYLKQGTKWYAVRDIFCEPVNTFIVYS